MYRVYLRTAYSNSEELLFDSQSTSAANIIESDQYTFNSAKLNVEKNKTGSFEFTVPYTHALYDKLVLEAPNSVSSKFMTVVIYKLPTNDTDYISGVDENRIPIRVDDYQGQPILGGVLPNYKWYWEGRIIGITKDFYKNKTVLCEGCLGLLNDGTIPLLATTYTEPKTGDSTRPTRNMIERLINIEYRKCITESHDSSDSKSIIYYDSNTDSSGKIYYTLSSGRAVTGSHKFVSNSVLDAWDNMKRIQVGNVTVATTLKYNYENITSGTTKTNLYELTINTCYDNILEVINKGLLERLGGYLKFYRTNNDFYVDYLKDPTKDEASAVGYIDFGVNLLDYTESYNINEVFTVAIPLGPSMDKDLINHYYDANHIVRCDWWRYKTGLKSEIEQPSTILCENGEGMWNGHRSTYTGDLIATINEFNKFYYQKMGIKGLQVPTDYGSVYLINYALVQKYGYIYKKLDLTSMLSDPTNGTSTSQLTILETALEYLKNYNPYEWQIDITGYDLSILDHDIEQFELGMVVECRSKFHFAQRMFLEVTKMEIDLLNPSNNKITIGDSKKSGITDQVSKLEGK